MAELTAADKTLNIPGHEQPTGTTGQNDPQAATYKDYHSVVSGTDNSGKGGRAWTMTDRSDAVLNSLKQHVYDPWGGTGDIRGERGRLYHGAWVDPYDTTNYTGDAYRNSDGIFKYNQMLMTVAENFDPFMQKQEAENPHWWINRIPRRAYKLFDGLVHQTNLYRGGLSIYSGLGDWEDLQADPTKADACAPMDFRTYQYAWETRAWSGKKTAWGSDPICLDIFKYTPHAIEQLGWILETGVKFGTDIQNIWNRDMFIYHSVMAQRSYVMSKEYRGTSSARYVYEPFCKFEKGSTKALVADTDYVKKPFVIIDATFGSPEPVNFNALQLLRRELERVCPDGAVGSLAGSRMYAIGISADDLDNYIRGNEEERRNYLEADPRALIKGFDIAPTTFRRWLITEDGDQLRFRFLRVIPAYTDDEAKHYGYVGYKEFNGKKVFVAEAVDPMRGGKPGINGAPIPEANPDYDLAELAIAPVFINHVFTNEFVPSVSNLGHGTYFGVVKGLNGQWGWYNIRTKENPDEKIGNFRGVFEIVPRPETRAVYATSFIYRRCTQTLESLCPAENAKISPSASTTETTIASGKTATVNGAVSAEVVLAKPLVLRAGDAVTVKVGSSTSEKTYPAIVVNSLTLQQKVLQFTGSTKGTDLPDTTSAEVDLKGATITKG